VNKRSVYIQTDHLPKIEGSSVATAFWVLDNMRCITHWGVFLVHCQYLTLGRRFQPPPRLPSDTIRRRAVLVLAFVGKRQDI